MQYRLAWEVWDGARWVKYHTGPSTDIPDWWVRGLRVRPQKDGEQLWNGDIGAWWLEQAEPQIWTRMEDNE
jgi:hypothetical protein